MKVIGVTGGVGSGKSMILDYLEKEYHAVVYKADDVAKDLQKPGQEVYRKMLEHFGVQILTSDGEFNRSQIANIIFQDKEERDFLNKLIHPEVKSFIKRAIQTEREKKTQLFIVEAALLLEDHYDEICDEIWFIYADENVRRRRLKDSRGYSDEKILSIMKTQETEEFFREQCDKVINNSGNFIETVREIKKAL